jgi:hypothetical protein
MICGVILPKIILIPIRPMNEKQEIKMTVVHNFWHNNSSLNTRHDKITHTRGFPSVPPRFWRGTPELTEFGFFPILKDGIEVGNENIDIHPEFVPELFCWNKIFSTFFYFFNKKITKCNSNSYWGRAEWDT